MPLTIPGFNADGLSFPDGTGLVTLTRLPVKTQKAAVVGTTLHFDGLEYPRAYFGENADESWDVAFRVIASDGDQWANLRALLASRSVLLWRDTLGNVTYCVVTAVSQDPNVLNPTYFTDLKFSLTRVIFP